jgi:hypothetical protein
MEDEGLDLGWVGLGLCEVQGKNDFDEFVSGKLVGWGDGCTCKVVVVVVVVSRAHQQHITPSPAGTYASVQKKKIVHSIIHHRGYLSVFPLFFTHIPKSKPCPWP